MEFGEILQNLAGTELMFTHQVVLYVSVNPSFVTANFAGEFGFFATNSLLMGHQAQLVFVSLEAGRTDSFRVIVFSFH